MERRGGREEGMENRKRGPRDTQDHEQGEGGHEAADLVSRARHGVRACCCGGGGLPRSQLAQAYVKIHPWAALKS